MPVVLLAGGSSRAMLASARLSCYTVLGRLEYRNSLYLQHSSHRYCNNVCHTVEGLFVFLRAFEDILFSLLCITLLCFAFVAIAESHFYH